MTFHITLRELIDKNREFLAKEMLGAQGNCADSCNYLYGSGHRCGIGAVLPSETIKVLSRTKQISVAIDDLIEKRIVSSDVPTAILTITQNLHDTWNVGRTFYCLIVPTYLPECLRAFVLERDKDSGPTEQKHYEAWLDLLDKHYDELVRS